MIFFCYSNMMPPSFFQTKHTQSIPYIQLQIANLAWMRYNFYMTPGSQSQTPYRASTNGVLTFGPAEHEIVIK